ncbi:MAG: AMP-binding protein [Nocardioidaceae bacterium]
MAEVAATHPLLSDATIPDLFERAVHERGHRTYVEFDTEPLSVESVSAEVGRAIGYLRGLGVARGTRVAVMLPNHPRHVVLVLALILMRAIWVPINTKQRGEPLRHQLRVSSPELLIVDAALTHHAEVVRADRMRLTVWHQGDASPWHTYGTQRPVVEAGADDVVSLMFTSGTSGPAKAVQVTDRMLRASALGAQLTGDVGDDDVLLMWEPLCHIGGAQVLLVPLVCGARIALLERFSASRFWDQAARTGATHIHHLGGILSMLLAAPEGPADRAHRVRVSWGGGMNAELWTCVEDRFGLSVRECYGMTEASSIVTINRSGPDGGVGTPVPYFDVRVHDEHGRRVPDGTLGQIVARPLHEGLVTPGYLDDTDATAAAWHDGYWHTGDSGYLWDGSVHFAGRLGDSVRHRGENVSAWEVESVANGHPDVAESALIGVPEPHGEQDLALFVSHRPGGAIDASGVVDWCRDRLAAYQVPRYVVVVDAFAKTPSQRIIKRVLRDRDEPWYDAYEG